MKELSAALLLVVVLGYAGSVAATDFEFDGIRLVVPNVFGGPVRATPDQRSETVAFSVPRGPNVATNVLQLTRYDFGEPLPPSTDDESFEAASKYLLEMMRGIERHRTSYTQTAPERAVLGGEVGARSTWTGQLRGVPVNGVMYAIVIGSRVIFFHAFGPGDAPDAQLMLAIRAIEALQHDI